MARQYVNPRNLSNEAAQKLAYLQKTRCPIDIHVVLEGICRQMDASEVSEAVEDGVEILQGIVGAHARPHHRMFCETPLPTKTPEPTKM